ncbi:MAG TPA: dephospho-CoA kinase [Pyrinomonadaceae bacterium]|nr:dephospho-CoA kinase [Pyrinomonadaceae bacterium]
MMMLKVGLTGSIAVGKSHVLGIFKELGCHTIDADKIAREVVTPDSEGLNLVVENFGREVLQPDGSLDRQKLGAIVFADEAKRRQLNSILHPLIIAAQDEQIRQIEQTDPKGIVIIDAALMIESGGYRRMDKLIVVYCEPGIQLQRLMRRDGLPRETAESRIAAQMPQDAKKTFADFLINTSGDHSQTRTQVEGAYLGLRALAA